MNWLKKIYTTVITVHKRVLCTLGVKLSLLTILNLTGAGRFSTFQKKYLLPGVKLQGGDADLFNLIFSDTKQQVPMRLGGQRYLGKDGIKRLNTSISWTDGQWQWTKKKKKTLLAETLFPLTCRALAARYMQAQAMVSAWNLTNTLVLRLSFM